jgi:hypothetical protein
MPAKNTWPAREPGRAGQPAGAGARPIPMSIARVAGLLGLALAPLLAVGCSDRTNSAAPPTPSSRPPVGSAPASPSSAPAASAQTSAARPTDLTDGRHAVRITRVDPAARRITVDVIEIFLGEDAARAAEEDKAAEIPPPNDVWIRNVNPRLRTLSVATDAPITVNVHGAAESGSATKDIAKTLPELAALGHLDDGVFWVTLTGGRITRIAEQYLP